MSARTAPSRPKKKAPAGLTTYEAFVLDKLSNTPVPVEVLASRAGLTRGEARLAIEGLVRRGIALLRAGSGYALATSTSLGTRRHGDVIEDNFAVLVGDSEERLGVLPDSSVDAMVLSSPYWKERDYNAPGQLGWEATPEEFVARLTKILAQCARVISPYGLIFFNFDDHVDRGKQSCIDAMLMTKLRFAGLEKFREIIWSKTSRMPNGTDNAPAHAYEKIFVLKKAGGSHYWDTLLARQEAKSGGMKRLDDVWTFPVASSGHARGKHFAAFPVELVERCLEIAVSEKGYCQKCGAPWVRKLERGVSTWRQNGTTRSRTREAKNRSGKADFNAALLENGKTADMKMADMRHAGWRPSCHHKGTPRRPLIADPFLGSGTTGIVAVKHGYDFFGIDINPDYVSAAAELIRKAVKGSDR